MSLRTEQKLTGGNWSKSESEMHINYIELVAWLTIQSFCKGTKIAIFGTLSTNTTAVRPT